MIIKKKIIKEGFGIATQDNSLKDPMFERLGPPSVQKVTEGEKQYWLSFTKKINSLTDEDYFLKDVTTKGTSRTIVLEGSVGEVIIYQDWSTSSKEAPIVVLQIETPEGDIIKKLGKVSYNLLCTEVSKQLNKDKVMAESKSIKEKAVSKKQQQFFAVADQMRKRNIEPKGEAGEVANSDMSTKEIEKFSKTKTKDLPTKVKKENVQVRAQVALLKEKLEKLTGRKVILKEGVERVSIDEMNNILSQVPPQEKIALYMITKVNMNKNIVNKEGQKVPNPLYDKVIKKNIVYGRVNFNYSDEYKGTTGTEYKSDPNSKRTLGDKQGAITIKDGKARLPITDYEYGTPTYEVNGNEITKEELTPYLPVSNSTSSSSGVQMIAPLLANVKKIAIGNKEYQVI